MKTSRLVYSFLCLGKPCISVVSTCVSNVMGAPFHLKSQKPAHWKPGCPLISRALIEPYCTLASVQVASMSVREARSKSAWPQSSELRDRHRHSKGRDQRQVHRRVSWGLLESSPESQLLSKLPFKRDRRRPRVK